jgi:hypothetical protein
LDIKQPSAVLYCTLARHMTIPRITSAVTKGFNLAPSDNSVLQNHIDIILGVLSGLSDF